MHKITEYVRKQNKLLQNFSYITLLQVFILLVPLITYPYLVEVLGMELYGVVLSAQMLASYATLIVDFGSNSVCAKYVSINRENKDKLAEIVNSILIVRLLLFVTCFAVYMIVVVAVPVYRPYYILFLLSYGIVLNDVLYPQYFFQGIENMKAVSIISISSKLMFVLLIFIVVRKPDDYLYIPVFYMIGYMIAGIVALYIIYKRYGLRFYVPRYREMKVYINDAMPLFATDLISTIKDKFNYMLVGTFVNMQSVVIYDLAVKFNNLMIQPMRIINMVMFPRLAKSRNIQTAYKVIGISSVLTFILIVLLNVFLPWIVDFFVHQEIDLIPVRIMSVAPLFMVVSIGIASNIMVAMGFNRYLLYSIIVTTVVYLLVLIYLLLANRLGSIYSFVLLALVSFFAEMLYRIIVVCRIKDKLSNQSPM